MEKRNWFLEKKNKRKVITKKMTNREKYLFDDFTFENYRRLIQIAKNNGFQFILHKDKFNLDRKDIIWRHDVEFSPEKALKMARIEYEEGVCATYFWQLHSNYYNTASTFFLDILKQISDLGHHIGLHFDSHFWNINTEEELNSYIRLDAEYLESIMRRVGLENLIDTFSFHNTNEFILNCRKSMYGNLINVYSSYFKEHYDYCGDSTGIWRFDRLEDRINDPEIRHLQVLTHDGVWSDRAMSPHARVMNSIQSEADRLKTEYAIKLPQTGNINVGEYSLNPNIDEI